MSASEAFTDINVVVAWGPATLEEKLREQGRNGWRLYGSPTVQPTGEIVQIVIKVNEDERNQDL